MNRYCIVLTVFILLTALIVAAHSFGAPFREPPTAQSRFLGTWKLVSTEEKLKDGSSRPYTDIGPNGEGYLVYTPDGHMCAVLARPNRPKWDNPPSAAQKIAAIEGLASYCGAYEIDEANHVMWHYPEIAWDPGFAGTKQPRPYRFEKNQLIFSGQPLPNEGQNVIQWTIVWEKAK